MIKYLFIIALFISNFAYANIDAAKCAGIGSDQERLDCYDLIFKANDELPLDSNIKTLITPAIKAVTPADSIRIENKATKEKDFGLPKTKIKNSAKNSIKTSVVKINKTKSGKLIFTLENEQKWTAETTYRARNMFKPETAVILEEAPVSGFYMINISNKQKIRIKRLK
jgi:hypothetical protein